MRPLLRCVVATLAGLAGIPAGALEIGFAHPYGELVEVASVTALVSPRHDLRPDCAAGIAVTQVGKAITLTLRTAAVQTGPAQCITMSTLLEPLAAGNYLVTAQYVGADGTVADRGTRQLHILPLEGRCNDLPAMSPAIYGRPKSETAAQFVARVEADAAFAASLGHPAVRVGDIPEWVYFDYPPLEGISPALERLTASGKLEWVSRNGYACFATSPPDAVTQVVEFIHAGLDHYFYSGDAGEIATIDAGKVGPWTRTGKSFRVVTQPGCIGTTTDTVVYRFFGRPGAGPNSHFFTRDRAECYAVDKSAQWDFEGLPFWATEPRADGTCPAPFAQQRVPLYRVWRPFGDSNHRFTTERAVVAQMVAQGWVDEGLAMCVLPPG